MEARIKDVMSAVFGVDPAEVTEEASPDTVAGWDSIGHMKLVVALEDEFGIQFSDEQIPELLNMKLIKLSISECLNAK